MYWPYDSKNHPNIYNLWTDRNRVWNEEILNGYNFGIPTCCIAWYIIAVFLCLLAKADSFVLPFMFGKDGWEEFLRLDYYRCPLCRILKREIKARWSFNE